MMCPIRFERIDGTLARIHAALISLCALTYLAGYELFIWVMAIDFTLRILKLESVSPLFCLSRNVQWFFSLHGTFTDAAPKAFAALLGAGIVWGIVLGSYFGLMEIAVMLSVILIFCATLEAIIDFCLGCYVYGKLHTLKAHFIKGN